MNLAINTVMAGVIAIVYIVLITSQEKTMKEPEICAGCFHGIYAGDKVRVRRVGDEILKYHIYPDRDCLADSEAEKKQSRHRDVDNVVILGEE